jgi:hypothetical protein
VLFRSFCAKDGAKSPLNKGQEKLAANVQLQMTLARAQASANVPAAERPNGRVARVEEPKATQHL